MASYSKSYSEPSDLVTLLKSRGLGINDEWKAQQYLRRIGYYRMSEKRQSEEKLTLIGHLITDAANVEDFDSLITAEFVAQLGDEDVQAA